MISELVENQNYIFICSTTTISEGTDLQFPFDTLRLSGQAHTLFVVPGHTASLAQSSSTEQVSPKFSFLRRKRELLLAATKEKCFFPGSVLVEGGKIALQNQKSSGHDYEAVSCKTEPKRQTCLNCFICSFHFMFDLCRDSGAHVLNRVYA